MRRIVLSLTLAACAALPLLASAAPKTAQQELMAKCSAQNKGKTGDAYKQAQSACLRGQSSTAATGNSSQQRMRDCNAQAADKKLSGDARKSFMSSCLKSH